MQKKSALGVELLLTAVMGLMAVYMIVAASAYKPEGRIFPQGIAALTLAMCVIQVVNTLRASKKAAAASEPEDADGAAEEKPQAKRRIDHLLIVVIAAAYLLLFKPLGFIVCTVLAMGLIPYMLGYRKHVVTWIMSVALTLTFYFIFKVLFYVPLPGGILSFI